MIEPVYLTNVYFELLRKRLRDAFGEERAALLEELILAILDDQRREELP